MTALTDDIRHEVQRGVILMILTHRNLEWVPFAEAVVSFALSCRPQLPGDAQHAARPLRLVIDAGARHGESRGLIGRADSERSRSGILSSSVSQSVSASVSSPTS
jgi:hypothetical protein